MFADTLKVRQFQGFSFNGGENPPSHMISQTTTNDRKLRYIDDSHGKHSCDTCKQHKAPEMVLTTCRLKSRKQRPGSRVEPYLCGVLPLPPPLPRASSPTKTAETCWKLHAATSAWNRRVFPRISAFRSPPQTHPALAHTRDVSTVFV